MNRAKGREVDNPPTKPRKKKQRHRRDKKRRNLDATHPLPAAPRRAKDSLPEVFASGSESDITASNKSGIVPYDEGLLDRARTLWQFGDWESLCELKRAPIRHHPDRAKIALLVAASHLQIDNPDTARQYIRLARDWGCSKSFVAQILAAGVHNSLGCARLADRQDQRALAHFEDAIALVISRADRKLFGEARAVRAATRMGLLPEAARLMDTQLAVLNKQTVKDQARVKILETELELLHHELSLAQQRQQLDHPGVAMSAAQPDTGSSEWLEGLKQKSMSQLGQDLWVLERTAYKRCGFFVEIGATDGVLLSNTWLLEKHFAWRGICVEPNPKFFRQLVLNRQCQAREQFVGPETGRSVEFILADAYGRSSEFADGDSHKDKRMAYAAAGRVCHVRSVSLDDLLEESGAPHEIDYISIDTEGSEYDILRTFPFRKWRVRLFSIEHNYTGQRSKIRQLLEDNDYSCTEQQWDDWYEKIDQH